MGALQLESIRVGDADSADNDMSILYAQGVTWSSNGNASFKIAYEFNSSSVN